MCVHIYVYVFYRYTHTHTHRNLKYMFGKCVKFPAYIEDFIGFKNGMGF